MIDVKKLKPCPLCGGPPRIEEIRISKGEDYVHIRCMGCGLELCHTQYWYLKPKMLFGIDIGDCERTVAANEDAITRWNTRVGDKDDFT